MQLIVLQRYREVENLDGHYIFLLGEILSSDIAPSKLPLQLRATGAYRALYILNWVYRSYYEQYYHHNYVVYAAGIVQTMLYADFFYYYVIRSAH